MDEDGNNLKKNTLNKYEQCFSLSDKYAKICEMENQTYGL